jgi:hypothetical protein
MIFNDKPLHAPSFDTVLEWDVKVVSLPPTAHLQARAPYQLMLPSGHPRPTMVQILPQAKVWQNAKKSFTQVNKDRNLQNGIGVQMG